jgi:hypothetical protein
MVITIPGKQIRVVNFYNQLTKFYSDIPLKSHTYISPFVRVGHLTLGNEIKDKFNDYVEVTSDERPERKDVKLHMGIYYHCDDVWNPEVGDIRVQFYYAGVANEIVCLVLVKAVI